MEEDIYYPQSDFITGAEHEEDEYGEDGEDHENDEGDHEREEGYYPEEEGEFSLDKPGFKEMQQVGFGGGKSVEGISSKIQGMMKSPKENAVAKASQILTENIYGSLSGKKKEKILKNIENIPNIQIYNINTLVLAELWKIENISLTKESFRKFVNSKASQVDAHPVDLFRYIRILETLPEVVE